MSQSLRLLRTDFTVYARAALKIRTKDGGVKPFALNTAQRYIHARIEEQLARSGKVRALILKGRQQGCCLDPETNVLTADLRWVAIKNLREGDQVVACDENPVSGSATDRRPRKMRTAVVQKVWKARRPAFRVTFADGTSFVCSAEHRWLSRKSQPQAEWRSIGGSGRWPDGRDGLKPGDHVRSITRVWGDPTLTDAWFGGVIDGEGSLDYKRRSGVDMSVSQRAGAVLDRMTEHCTDREYPFCVVSDDGPRKTKLGQEPVHAISISNMPSMFRLIGLSRPLRFIGKHWWDGKRMPDNGWRQIVSIEPLGEMDLVDIQTSTQTYIAEGFVSHNSTYVEGRFYWKVSGQFGRNAYILTHEQKATDNLFGMAQRYHQHCPAELRPSTKRSNAKELYFDRLDSGYQVATAGSEGTGRSGTAQYFHGSEVAHWPNAESHMAGIGQVVPSGDAAAGTEIILETTANGIGDLFHRMWQSAERGEGEYIAIFVPWFWQEEYRAPAPPGFQLTEDEIEYQDAYGLSIEQMVWRRFKITDEFGGDTGYFDQEYPATADLAFVAVGTDSFIKSKAVARARRQDRIIERWGPKIIGVDPARFGDDATAIIRRQGRVAYNPQRFTKLSTMEVAGRIARIIDDERPDQVFIDIGGLGAGIYDRLVELRYGKIVSPVNFGERAHDERKYANRRAEMWGGMKEWLDTPGGVLIPDSNALHGDLIGPQYAYDSLGRTKLEKKEDMRKRGLSSPDDGDALALTFADPVRIGGERREEVDSWRERLRALSKKKRRSAMAG